MKTMKFEQLKKLIAPKTNPLSVGSKFYIPFNGKDEEFVIIGINENPGSEDKSKNYIDLMSTRCIIDSVSWKENYSEDDYDRYIKYLHYYKSDIIHKLKELEQYLPEEIKNIIIPRKAKFLVSHNTYSNEKEYDEFDIGNIWLPSLKEVTGTLRYSDSSPEETQYSYFFEDVSNRALDKPWWLRSANFENQNFVCRVDSKGDCDYNFVSRGFGAPICFRLEIEK